MYVFNSLILYKNYLIKWIDLLNGSGLSSTTYSDWTIESGSDIKNIVEIITTKDDSNNDISFIKI